MKVKIAILGAVILMAISALYFAGKKSEADMNFPEYLYIIVSPEVWRESSEEGKLVLPSHHDAFIHLAKEDQVSHVTEKFWSGSDYYLLKIETDQLIGRLVYETNPGGSNRYYHLYHGEIPLEAISEVEFVKSGSP